MPRAALILVALAALPACRTVRPEAEACRTGSQSAQAARAPRKYALIVNGDVERRHKLNAVNAWRTLRTLGFSEKNVFVLTAPDRRIRLPRELVRLRPSVAQYAEAFDTLAASAKPGDIVVIYGTGHGDTSEEGESFLELGRDELWAFDLRDDVDSLTSDTVVIMDQCFSGGFTDAFEGTRSRAIVISTVDAKHPTECSYFAEAFWGAFLHPEQADANRDGRTSVREAFNVAIAAHHEALEGDPELRTNGSCRSFNGLNDLLLN